MRLLNGVRAGARGRDLFARFEGKGCGGIGGGIEIRMAGWIFLKAFIKRMVSAERGCFCGNAVRRFRNGRDWAGAARWGWRWWERLARALGKTMTKDEVAAAGE